MYQLGSWKELRLDKGIAYAITRKVSPSAPHVLAGKPFFCERFSEKGAWRTDLPVSNPIFISTQTKTPPARRGCFGLGIVPTGELEGRQDRQKREIDPSWIVPTGELEGRQDPASRGPLRLSIVPTGELEGRQDQAKYDAENT
ncbi:hypothetical protein, partial [Paratractidigestivibacter faecalis]|uniref:hypothetical protein n=1 Tax=Paratractidigestivibacter faecalis TaxID=2292441 RepID=UPI003AB11BFD